MRKILCITFIVVLFVNLFGFYIAFLVSQHEVRQEVMERIIIEPASHFRLFSLSKEEYKNLNWIEEGKEFNYNGRQFDVARIEESDEFVNLYVEEDTMEKELIDDFVSIVRQNSSRDQNGSPLKCLLDSFMKEFIVVDHTNIPPHSLIRTVPGQKQKALLSSPLNNLLFSPPDFS